MANPLSALKEHLYPILGGLFDLGASTARWRKIYSEDADFDGQVTVSRTPTATTDAVNKAYADALISGSLVFEEADGAPQVSGVTTVRFDQDDGFVLSEPGAGVARIDLADGGVPTAKLAASSVTVTAGTGLTGGGAVALGAAVTVNLDTPVSLANGGTGQSAASAAALKDALLIATWNQGADIASATPTLPNPLDASFYQVTGTTTITGFTAAGADAGTVLVFKFTGALQLTHNSTSFILQGATNATTAADDIYCFLYLGSGNWKELWRNVSGATSSKFWRGDGTWAAPTEILYSPGHIFGLTLSNDGTDPTNDIGIAVGNAASDDTSPSNMSLTGALIKRLDATWVVGTNQGGLDTGVIANDVYHVFLIKRPDTGVVDVLFSNSATAPTMPANYTLKRRIGSIIRASAAILLFTQRGDEFWLTTPVLDIDVTEDTTANTRTLASVPDGIAVKAMVTLNVQSATSSAVGYVSSLTSTDSAVALGTFHSSGASIGGGTSTSTSGGLFPVWTDTSGQIRTRAVAASTTFKVVTYGWIDTRGKDA
jgi:hypothetical protein